MPIASKRWCKAKAVEMGGWGLKVTTKLALPVHLTLVPELINSAEDAAGTLDNLKSMHCPGGNLG
jgi:hypothetical protein